MSVCFGAVAQIRTIKIDPLTTFQTIDHFSASDAWSGNYVGQYWDLAQKEQIAKWLFGQDMDVTGNPEGIGLSLWRVNLGAGTLEQDSADIVPFQRRSESFLTKDGKSYDWGKSSGQQYFIDTKGWNIRYVSPFNEPQVNWTTPRQEGSPWRNSEMKRLMVYLNESFAVRNLQGVKIMLAESSNLNWLYEDNQDEKAKARFGKDGPFKQLNAFFDPASPNYVGDLPYLARQVNAHDYHSHKTNKDLRETREKVGEAVKRYGLEFQQSEWCMLPGQRLPIDGFTADWKPENHADIQVALLMGRLVYGNMVYANATAWSYWKGMEINGDHALISLFPNGGNILNGGTVRSNKLLWALGNYSFFVRPGYKRIAMDGADDLEGLVSSAYIAPDNSRLVVVAVNSGFGSAPVKLELPKAYAEQISEVSMFRTDVRTDLGNLYIDKHYTVDREYTMAPRSITTMVFQLL